MSLLSVRLTKATFLVGRKNAPAVIQHELITFKGKAFYYILVLINSLISL